MRCGSGTPKLHKCGLGRSNFFGPLCSRARRLRLCRTPRSARELEERSRRRQVSLSKHLAAHLGRLLWLTFLRLLRRLPRLPFRSGSAQRQSGVTGATSA